MLGYKNDCIIHFQWVLHCQYLTTNFPPEHILSFRGQDAVKAVIVDILAQNTGITDNSITASFLLEQPELCSSLVKLLNNWNVGLIKKLFHNICSQCHDTKDPSLHTSYCTVDKCIFTASEISRIMMPASVIVHPTLDIPERGICPANDAQVVKKQKITENSFATPKVVHLDNSCSRAKWSERENFHLDESTLIASEVSLYDCSQNCHSIETIHGGNKLPCNLRGASSVISAGIINGNPTMIPMKLPVNIRSVFKFMRMLLFKFVPDELLGSSHNRHNFFKAVKYLVTSGCKDDFRLCTLMTKIRVTDCKWTRPLGSLQAKNYVVAKLLVWIIQRIVLVVIRTLFYATESDGMGHLILYYEKNLWCHLVDLTLNGLQKRGSLFLMPKSKAAQSLQVRKSPSKLLRRMRFIPKQSGMRPIYPIGRGNWKKPDALKMKLLASSVIKSYGNSCSTVRTRVSIADYWNDYLKWLEKLSVPSGPLYVVKLDVADAYGSVLHSVLLRVIEDYFARLPPKVRYSVYSKTDERGKCIGPRQYLMKDLSGISLEPPRSKTSHWIEVDAPIEVDVRSTGLDIKRYIQHQYISAGRNRKYLITKGIAQGGFLSSTLCELYYTSMHFLHWKNLMGPKDLCLHSVDDFLFVSPEKISAKRFLDVAARGVPDYNCVINQTKTLHNIHTNASPSRVTFCGVTFCSFTRQFLVSLENIIATPPRYTLKLSVEHSRGQFVALRLQQIAKTRLSAEVIHPGYTSAECLVVNLHRTGISVGARLEALCSAVLLPYAGRLNGRFLGSTLVSIAGKIWTRIKRIWSQTKQSLPPISKELVTAAFLGGVGSILCLKKHVQLPEVMRSITLLHGSFVSQIPKDQLHLLPRVELSKRLQRQRRHLALRDTSCESGRSSC
ncbi:telomerase reverse transcriptase [Hyalella azteca]|uniref:Telomerase reverse transcriptase n=1 Tax=Hyalella azteca TaxID=294128 RepID=A0A8B7NWU4_HYAAZ|nr:telomerase reverse transcriptase [Hyalella azteca]